MSNELQPRSRMRLWLIGLIILLGGICLVEGGIIYAMKHKALGNKQSLIQQLLLSRWMPLANPAQLGANPRDQQIPKDERIVLWESAQDIETIHDQINRLFSALSDSGMSVHHSPSGPSKLQPPGLPATDHLFQLHQEINRIFENAFDDMDVFSLPSRLEQGWDISSVSSSMQIEEQGSNYVVQVALPGLDRSAITISLQGRLLSIALNQDTDRQTRAAASQTGATSRREYLETKMMLPGPVDVAAAQATYRDGILRIEIPKSADEQEPLARMIKVI